MTDMAANAPQLRHPARELLGRYRAIFKAAWRHRHELAGPQRLADEAAFLPAALSLQDTPVHPAPRRLALALIALFLIALTWSVFGHVDIVAVAPGRIVVSQRTKVIQPLQVSVVQRVLVKDGDRVEAGQPLVELDPTIAKADKTSVDEQFKSAQSEVLRTRTLMHALAAPNDTYIFGNGSGQEVVADYDATTENTDVVQVAAGTSADQLWFSRNGADLLVSIIGTADRLTVSNWYSSNEYHVEQFKAGDGKILLDSQVQGLVDAMAAFGPPPSSATTLPANYQTGLETVLAASWH